MPAGRVLAIVSLSLALAASAVQAQTPASNAGQVLTFTEDVPCPPAAARAPGVHRVRHRVRRHRSVMHKAVVRVPRAVHHVIKARHVVRHRRPALVRASAPVSPTRCSVIRRERLTTASFGITPEVAELAPIADDIQPGGPALVSLTSGRPSLPNVLNPTAGGGQPGSPGTISAAPEPDQWMLLMLGTGAIGAVLRRRKRALAVS